MAATLASTTIPTATDAITNRVTLAAGTGITRGWLIICDAECMLVQAPIALPANTWQVLRGWDGTPAIPHKAGAACFYGPKAHFWAGFDRSGACDPNKEVVLPSINVDKGNWFDNSSGEWNQTKLGGTKATLT